MKRLAVLALLGGVAACTLTTSLDGFTGGDDGTLPTPDSGQDTATPLTPLPDASDFDGDAPTELDAGILDAPPDAAKCTKTSTAGPRYPTTETSSSFSQPENIEAQDGMAATVEFNPVFTTQASIMARGFGFAIPPDAIVQGVEVTIRRRGEDQAISDHSVKLAVANAQERASDTKLPGQFQNKTFGAPNDVWGVALTPAIVNDQGFGVNYQLKLTATNGSPDGFVDSIAITITYCE